jgi:two-component system, OmpR family, response regulator
MMTMKVLLVEDDHRTAAFVTKGLKEAGFVVQHVDNGTDGKFSALHESQDVVVLDLMLPGVDGLTILRAMRQAGVNTPVLILSAKGSVDEKVEGLRSGGDDYLAKPFAFAELLWRVQALLRRSKDQRAATRLVAGDLELDILTRKVTRGGRSIDLQPREFSLLEYLMRNMGRVVSKTMIMEHVWDYNFDPQTNVVESRMSRLRDKIDQGAEPPLIHTVRGAGYILKLHD